MPDQFSPLNVIVNPPELQVGMPGDLIQLYVVITNQGKYGAVIDIYIDEASQTLRQWCSSPMQRLALDPGHSSEVSFEFQIPVEALPGTYNYTLVVDAPEHYPEDTPINYEKCLLKVLLKEQTQVGISDPTFSLQPTTNPHNPISLKPNEPLSVAITVNNRSNRVDNFCLTCEDLASDWYSIRYPTMGLEGLGLQINPNGLNLNPAAQGTIVFLLHPPVDTLAGNYSPTLRLHSANSSNLVMLDLIYIHIPAIYGLDVELNTILGKVSRSPGQYEIKLANQGNTIRELAISAKGRDEEDLCAYQCDPAKVRLIPRKAARVSLLITPTRWWRRSLWGRGLDSNFQVEIQDFENNPLPEKLPQGTLIWKARPWWQFLVIILIILGLIGGISFLIWQIFFKPKPLEIVNFNSDNFIYTENDDRVLLSWSIRHPDQMQKLVLKTQEPTPSEVNYHFERGKLKEIGNFNNQIASNCRLEKEEQILNCQRVNIGTQKSGKYTLVLEVYDTQSLTSSKKIEFTVNAKPASEVNNLRIEQEQYFIGEPISLSWQIKNLEQLVTFTVITTKNGTKVTIPLKLNPEQLKELCGEPQKQLLTCDNIFFNKIIGNISRSGKYAFEFQVESKSSQQSSKVSEKIEVEILPHPGKIVTFTLNGQQAPANIPISVGTPLNLQWKVEGDEVTVRLNGSTVNSSDNKSLAPYTQAGQRQIRLEAFQSGQLVDSASFDIESVALSSDSDEKSSGKPSFDIESILPSGSNSTSRPAKPLIAKPSRSSPRLSNPSKPRHSLDSKENPTFDIESILPSKSPSPSPSSSPPTPLW